MKRFVWAAILAFPLTAQVWEGAQTVVREWNPNVRGRRAYAFERLSVGRPDERLPFPARLNERAALAYWKGEAYAFGSHRHPVLDKFPGEITSASEHLYRSRDFRTWEHIASYGPDMNEGGPPGRFAPSASPLVLPHVVAGRSPAITSDPHGAVQHLIPLEDGRFLALSQASFWVGTDISPLAVYEIGPDRRLRLHHLVDLGLGRPVFRAVPKLDSRGRTVGLDSQEDPELAPWGRCARFHRCPEGILLLEESGRMLLLDNRDGHVRARFELYPGAPSQRFPWTVLAASMGARGRLLILAREEADARQPRQAYGPLGSRMGENRKASGRLATELISLRANQAWASAFISFGGLRWVSLDPATGTFRDEAPPEGFPLGTFTGLQSLLIRFRFKADGHLEWAMPKSLRGFRDNLSQ